VLTSVKSLAARAVEVLRRNDTGLFVKPGPRVYPFQWNWDSALIAIGLARVDPERGRAEVRSLLRGQWTDGMVPHIVFHPQKIDYSPGPEVWASSDCSGAPEVATSGITQPPVLASAVRALHEADPDRPFLEEVLPALDAWHRWLERERSFDDSGLVAIVHPWESADNAPRFDAALARIDPRKLTFARSDRRHVDAAERPTDLEYERYLSIVEQLRDRGYRARSASEAPFAYVDLCFNSSPISPGSSVRSAGAASGHPPGQRASAPHSPRCGTREKRPTDNATCTATKGRATPSPTSFRSMPAFPTSGRRASCSPSRSGRPSGSALRRSRRGPSRPSPRRAGPTSPAATGGGRSGSTSTGSWSAASSAAGSRPRRSSCGG
jgi:hypothetical protein